MATYLTGVEDYIPQFQPFDPNLNFYANVLQTKQTQYDTNWKAINNIYGQYFYSDLSREPNIAKKDELLKQIDFNLKRVSGLDLSLEQNVQQATQVFKPFYDDQYLMKDMAWTKNYLNNRSKANNLKNSKDEKDREMYWDTGVKALDYMREEFRNLSDDDSLSFQNVNYTPYQNISETYRELAKNSGIKMETPSWSDDGKYKIITRNGQQIEAPLTYLFKSYAANDAQMQDIYYTQAYVNRQDYMYMNKDQFGGDLGATERNYLSEQYGTIQAYVNRMKGESSQEKTVIETNKNKATKAIQENKDNMFTNDYLQRLNESEQIISSVDDYNTRLQNNVSDGTSTSTTTSYTTDPNENIDVLRRKVDSGLAAMLMNQDIAEAAYAYSFIDYKVSVEADPYALESVRQANRQSLLKKKIEADEKNVVLEHGLKTGYYVLDYNTGAYKVNTKYDETLVDPDLGTAGGTTDAMSPLEINDQFAREAAEDYGNIWGKSIAGLLNQYRNNGALTERQLQYALGSGIDGIPGKDFEENPNVVKNLLADYKKKDSGRKFQLDHINRMAQTFEYNSKPKETIKELIENPTQFFEGKSYSQLEKIKNKVDAFMFNQSYAGDDNANMYITDPRTPLGMANINFERYLLQKKASDMVKSKNKETFTKELGNIDPELAGLYFNNGNPLDREDFIKLGVNREGQKNVNLSFINNLTPQGGPVGDPFGLGEALGNLIFSKDISKQYPLNEEQESRFKTYMQRELTKNPKLANNKDSRDNLKTRWYTREFNLNPQTGQEYTATSKEERLGNVYDQLKNKLTDLVTSNKLVSVYNSLNDINAEGGRFGASAVNATGTYINLNAAGTPGHNAFTQFTRDLKSQSLTQYEFSFDGNNKTSFDQEDLETPEQRRQIGDMIINQYRNLLNMGEKVDDPRLFQNQIAKEDFKKGAMTFFPQMDVLQNLIGTDKKPGTLTQEQANRIVQKGITIAALRNVWKNDLFMNNKTGGLEALINMGETIEYNTPYGGGFKIEPDKSTSSGYRIIQNLKIWDPDKKTFYYEKRAIPEVQFGKNLDISYLDMRKNIGELGLMNIEMYKNSKN